MDITESEEGKKKHPKKTNPTNQLEKSGKNPCETIHDVGTTFSEIQTCYLFVSGVLLSCFINNRLVSENEKMETSTVILHTAFWPLFFLLL